MKRFQNNSKLITVSEDHFLLLKEIANLGFVTKSQIQMLYSSIKGQPTMLSQHSLNDKLIKKDGLLISCSSKTKRNQLKQTVYYLSQNGRAMLAAYHCFYRNPQAFAINEHNWQANEVIIQSLYAAPFKTNALGSNNASWKIENNKMIITDALGESYEIPGLSNSLQRIYESSSKSKTKFDLVKYDIRPFNAQLGFNPTNKTHNYFEADGMISFKQLNQWQRIFVEMDNRTEDALSHAQKVLNYIYYANRHQEENFLLAIVAADGSLPTSKIKNFTYPDKHLDALISKILETKVGSKSVNAPTIRYYYEQCHNLKIIFAGLSEAPMRIAESIINANHNTDYICSAQALANRITEETSWSVIFKPMLQTISDMKNSPFFFDTEINNIHHSISGLFGYYYYESCQQGHLKLIQPIIAGNEWDLDTSASIEENLKKFNKDHVLKNGDWIPPIVIYPIRERPTHANTTLRIRNSSNWSSDFIAGQLYYYQPLLGVDNNPYLVTELRTIANRFSKDIYHYFATGYLTNSDQKANIQYGNSFLPYSYNHLLKKPRSYEQLRNLTNYLKAKPFVDQLLMTEIPLGVFKRLIERYQGKEFAIPVIATLPYAVPGMNELNIPNHIDLDNCLTVPDAVFSKSRIHVSLRESF